MKKIVLALSIVFALTSAVYAEEAVFQSMDSVEEIQKINLEPQGSQDVNATAPSVKKLSGAIQEENYKKAITSLDDASAEVREQLVNYNSQLGSAKQRKEIAEQEVKQLKKYVSQTKKKLNNIEKSKKIINANFETPEAK